jgi:DNA relaxase NicK
LKRMSESNRFWNGVVNHCVQARVAELLEHFAGVGGTRADVAVDFFLKVRSQIQSKPCGGK